MEKTKISYFEKVSDTEPKSFDLHKWLKMTINPPRELKDKVIQYRNLGGQRLKTAIPCVTISATFKKRRHLDNIKKKNNFIVLDIDRYAKNKRNTCNQCIDLELFKEMMMGFKATLYVGYSVSSDGVNTKDGMYAIIRTHKDDSLKKVFKFYKKKLKRVGVHLDNSCKDYTRLRFFSYDPNAYYNKDAKVYKLPEKIAPKTSGQNKEVRGNDLAKVMACVQVIERDSIDITPEYDDWYKIAGSLYNAFGENGREIFQRVSRFYKGYNRKKVDQKFDACSKMNKVSLSSFFYVAGKYNVRY